MAGGNGAVQPLAANHGVGSGLHRHSLGSARHHHGRGVDHIGRCAPLGQSRPQIGGVLLRNAVGVEESALHHRQLLVLKQSAIAGHHVSRRQQDQVALHHHLPRDLSKLPPSDHLGCGIRALAEVLQHPLGAGIGKEGQGTVQGDEHHHHQCAHVAVKHQCKHRRRQKQDRRKIREHLQKIASDRNAYHGMDNIFSILLQPRPCFLHRKSLFAVTFKQAHDLARRTVVPSVIQEHPPFFFLYFFSLVRSKTNDLQFSLGAVHRDRGDLLQIRADDP